MKRIIISETAVKNAVEATKCASEAARVLGVPYKVFRTNAKRYGLFKTNQNYMPKVYWKKNKTLTVRNLVDGTCTASRSAVKRFLFESGLKSRKCEICGITNWLGHSLSLELHHLDGNKKNNRLENLQVLCPNCHSQTNNYKGRNQKGFHRIYDSNGDVLPIEERSCSHKKNGARFICAKCGTSVFASVKNPVLCRSCRAELERGINKPSKQELEKEINSETYLTLEKKYGVSTAAIKKWARKYGIQLPHRKWSFKRHK